MNAHEIIESYVADVARQLPRKQRGDVAAELRNHLVICRAARRNQAVRNRVRF